MYKHSTIPYGRLEEVRVMTLNTLNNTIMPDIVKAGSKLSSKSSDNAKKPGVFSKPSSKKSETLKKTKHNADVNKISTSFLSQVTYNLDKNLDVDLVVPMKEKKVSPVLSKETESSDDEGLVIPVLKFEDIKKEKTKGLFNTTVKYSRDNYPKVANYDKNIQKHVDTIIEAVKQGIHYATFDINDTNDRLSYGKDSKETNTYNIEYRKMNQNGEAQNLNVGTFQIRKVIG